jgi:hypothetical protein
MGWHSLVCLEVDRDLTCSSESVLIVACVPQTQDSKPSDDMMTMSAPAWKVGKKAIAGSRPIPSTTSGSEEGIKSRLSAPAESRQSCSQPSDHK